MKTKTHTPKPNPASKQKTEAVLDGATCSASLSPVAYRIKQHQTPHAYWIQNMILGPEGPLWFVVIRLGDPSAYLRSLKEGYDTPEAALKAWQDYADLNWPNA